MKHYLAYRYTLKSTDQSIFLFGFLIPFDDYIDGLESNKKIEINVSEYHKFDEDSEEHGKYKDHVLVMETSVVREDSFNAFNEKLNNNIFSFKMLGFDIGETLDEEVKVLYSSEAFLDISTYETRLISSHKYRYLWLCDRFQEIDIPKILPIMNDYAHHLFIQSSNHQLGSFFLMNNSMIFKESFIKVSPQNMICSFELSQKYDFTDHTLHLILKNASHHVVVNKVSNIKNNKIEDIALPEDISHYYIELFDSFGNLVFTEDCGYLQAVSISMCVLGSSSHIKGELLEKNTELSSINTSINNQNIVVNAPIISSDGYTKFCKFYHKVRDFTSNVNEVEMSTKDVAQKSFWFDKMDSKECISTIRAIVKDSDEAIFVDRYFKAKEENLDDGIENLTTIIMRLDVNVMVITSSLSSDFAKSKLTNITSGYNDKLQIKIKKTKVKYHDRYLLIKKKYKQTLYSLTNSINAINTEQPIGIFNVLGDPMDLIIDDINGLIKRSVVVYDSNYSKNKTANISHTKIYSNIFTEDIKKEGFEDYVTNHLSVIIGKFNDIRDNNIAAYFYLADLQAYLSLRSESYKQIEIVLLKSIEMIDDKVGFIEDVKSYVLDKEIIKDNLGDKKMDLQEEFSIDAYNKISSFYMYGTRSNSNVIYGWTNLLYMVFLLDPDLLINYLNASEDNLSLDIYEKIYLFAHFSEKELLQYKNKSLKLLGVCRIFDQDKIEIKDSIEEIINRLIDHGIPKHLVFCITIQHSYIFLDEKNRSYDENFVKLIKSDIFKDILDDSNLKDFTKDIFMAFRGCNERTIHLFKIILESNVMIEKNSRKITRDFLEKYLKQERYSLASEWGEINDIIGVIDFFNKADRIYILDYLYESLNIKKHYNEVSVPLFTEITAYQVHSKIFKKIARLLCIYSAFPVKGSDNIDKLLNLLINREQGDEETTFIIVGTLLRIILRDTDQIEDSEKIQSFFSFLKNNDRLSIFYDIYYKNYDEDTLKKYMDLVFKSQYNELALLKTFSAIIIEIIHIQYLNSSDEREKNIDNVKTMINSYFNGKYTVK